MTSINNISDLARILREQPEWADTIRGLLLSKELLDLPDQFAKFVEMTNRNFQLVHERLAQLEADVGVLKTDMTEVKADVAVLKTDMTEVKADVGVLKTDMTEVKADVSVLKTDMITVKADVAVLKTDMTTVKADVAVLKSDMGQVKGQLGNALGINYEFKIEKNIASIAGRHLQVRRTNVLKGAWTALTPDLMDLIEQAEDDGIITGDQSYELGLTDLIFDGRRRDDASVLHVAAEVSITIGDIDITRATERADILRAVINQPVVPAVIGSRIDDARAAMAAANNVTLILMPDA